MDFDPSPRAAEMRDRTRAFVRDRLLPRNRDWQAWVRDNRGDPPWFDELKAQARAEGLWNMGVTTLPEGAEGTPLSNLDFAPAAEEMGRLSWAPIIFNCHAPDLPNIITLMDAGSAAQQERYLAPLLRGEVRSAFAMTEPDTASSDARNIAMSIRRTDRGYVLNGRKWFASGAAHPDCKFLIVVGQLEGSAERAGHTALMVPMDTPGLTLDRRIRYMGWDEPAAPIGELSFADVEVPADALLGGEGQGFAVAQTRLGPARVHHCMRALGLAEVLIELMTARAAERQTFGRQLTQYDTVQGWIAKSRIEVEQARLIVLRCAWALDRAGHSGAWRDVSVAKVAVPAALHATVDRALQVFGAAGGTDDTPIHAAAAWARAFRIFDGPDEVHLRQIFKQEAAPTGPLADSPYMVPYHC